LREEIVFRAVEDEAVCRMNEMAHLWHSCAGAPGFEEDGSRVEYHRKEAAKVFRDIGRLRLPWYKQWARDEGKELADAWKAFKEMEKDPEYAKKLRRMRTEVNEKAEEARREAQALSEISESIRKRQAEASRRRRRRQRAGFRRATKAT
jgi:hypothetical protein